MENFIIIPSWIKEEKPTIAKFCELINNALEQNPNMSLAQFAQVISKINIEKTIQRVQRAEEKQFGVEKKWATKK